MNEKSGVKNGAVWVGLALCLAASLYSVWRYTLQAYKTNPDTDITYFWAHQQSGVTTDAEQIVSGLREKKHFSDTLKFWTGPWAWAGENQSVAAPNAAYYRPMTSTLWWMLYRATGPNGLAWWLAVLALSHVVFSLLLFGFLNDLFKNIWSATLSVVLWLLCAAETIFGFYSAKNAIQLWIDHVEPWVGICIIGSLWFFLRYIRGNRNRDLTLAGIAFVVGITVKEMIYVVPMLAFLVLWHECRMSEWKKTIPFWIFAASGLALRAWALSGHGTFAKTKPFWDGAWMCRAANEVFGGSVGAMAARLETLPFALASLMLCTVCIATKRIRWSLLWAASTTIFLLLAAWNNRGLDDPFYLQLFGGTRIWFAAMTCFLLAMLWWSLITQGDRSQRFGWFWLAICYLPFVGSANTAHIYYIPSIGWAIVLALAIRQLMLQMFLGVAHSYKIPKMISSNSGASSVASTAVLPP